MLTSRERRIRQAILAASVLAGLASASLVRADDIQFLLLGGTSQKLTFLGSGDSNTVLIQLGSCSNGICDWTEQGRGSVSYGANQLAGYSGLWSLSIPYTGTNTFNLTLTPGFNGNPSDWGVSQPSPINFTWGTAGCSGANCLLAGNLELTDLVESGNGGTFNLGMDVDLIITGGILASLVNQNDILDYTITFSPGTGTTRKASGSSGEAAMPTSELGSLLLLGTGLGLLGFVRRLRGRLGPARR
jgi:hypothetical protein